MQEVEYKLIQQLDDIKRQNNKIRRVEFIVRDNSIINRAKSLGYKTYRINNETVAIIANSTILVCNPDGFRLIKARYLFLNLECEELDLSNIDTSQAILMDNMFFSCDRLEYLNISSFNTSRVIDMSSMFSGCTNLKRLDLSNFNTARVTSMSKMFEECNSLEQLNISSFDTSKVVTMNSMFRQCKSLKKLDVSHFNTANLRDAVVMFSDCSSLVELDINNFNTSNIRRTQGMFEGCSSLKSLKFSNIQGESIGLITNDLFKGCNNLKEIDFSKSRRYAIIKDIILKLSQDTPNITRHIYLDSKVADKLLTELQIDKESRVNMMDSTIGNIHIHSVNNKKV